MTWENPELEALTRYLKDFPFPRACKFYSFEYFNTPPLHHDNPNLTTKLCCDACGIAIHTPYYKFAFRNPENHTRALWRCADLGACDDRVAAKAYREAVAT